MTNEVSRSSLERARQEAGLSMDDLWVQYISLGGTASLTDMAALVTDAATPTAHDHDLLAQVLNERFLDLGRDMPIRYSGEGG